MLNTRTMFRRVGTWCLAFLSSLMTLHLSAATDPEETHAMSDSAAMQVELLQKPSGLREILLYDSSANVTIDPELWERFFGQVMVRNVSVPTLIPVLPALEKRNGKAIVIVPGGGYQFISIENEGFGIAEQLVKEGFSTFIVKYRLPRTPVDAQQNQVQLAQLFGNLGKKKLADWKAAVDDVAATLKLVSSRASEWGIDPERIGIVGFSAGARTTIRLLEQRAEASLADHIALLYPPMDQVVEAGPRPPLFLAIAADDPLFKQGGMALPEAWYQQSKDIEMHVYSGGSHGFGSRSTGTTSDIWMANYLNWLKHVK